MPMLQPDQRMWVLKAWLLRKQISRLPLALIWLQQKVLFDTFFRVRLLTTLFSSFFLFSIWQLVPLVSAAGYWDW